MFGAKPVGGCALASAFVAKPASAFGAKPVAVASAFGAQPAGGSAATSLGGGLPTTVTLAKGTESEAHGFTFAAGESPLRITAIAEGSPCTKGFGMKAKVGQVLVAVTDKSAGGFMGKRQDVMGMGEAEVIELLAKSGRPLQLSFKAAAIAEDDSGTGSVAKPTGGSGLGGAITSSGAGPRYHTQTHPTGRGRSVCLQPKAEEEGASTEERARRGKG